MTDYEFQLALWSMSAFSAAVLIALNLWLERD